MSSPRVSPRGRVGATRAQRRGRGGVVVLLVLAVFQVFGALCSAAPASAHATLVSTAPADGSHLDQGPTQVVFTLDEAVSPVDGSAQVIDQDGKHYDVVGTDLGGDRSVLTVRLAQALPSGSYLATARMVSLDTHVVSVSASFTVGESAGQLLRGPAGSAPGFWDQAASVTAKLLVYFGAVLSAGVLVTTAWLWPELRSRRRWRAIQRWGGAVLAVGLALRLLIDAVHRAGGLAQLPGAVGSTVESAFGAATIVALLVALANSLFSLSQGTVARLRVTAVVTAVVTVTAVGYGGHGAEPARYPLPLVLTELHIYAVLAWLGGVVLIAVVPGAAPRPAPWHRYALGHVAVVVVAGIGLALLRVPAFGALPSTAYGLALLAKSALVVLVIGVAATVYRRLATGGDRVGFLGARTIRLEIALAVAVFGATSVLSSVAPATVSYDPAVRTTMDFGGGAVLDIAIPSSRRGHQTIVVTSAKAGSALTVDLSSQEANVARLPVTFAAAERVGTGTEWTSSDLVVPLAGTWQVSITFDAGEGPRVASFYYEVR